MGTHSDGHCNILGKQNALELNDKEVDELFNVIEESLQGLLGNAVVSTRTKGGSHTGASDSLSNDLG